MKEQFIEAHKLKIEIEKKIDDIYNINDFKIKDSENILYEYKIKTKLLENNQIAIKNLINDLTSLIVKIKNDLIKNPINIEDANFNQLWSRYNIFLIYLNFFKKNK